MFFVSTTSRMLENVSKGSGKFEYLKTFCYQKDEIQYHFMNNL